MANWKELDVCMEVSLWPSSLNDLTVYLNTELSRHLMKFVPSLGGVLLSWSNLRLLEPSAHIFWERPEIHLKIGLSVVVFSPDVGDELVGTVTSKGTDYISLLVYSTWHATLKSSEVPNYDEIEIGHKVTFYTLKINVIDDKVSISGSIKNPKEPAKKKKSKKKSSKKLELDKKKKSKGKLAVTDSTADTDLLVPDKPAQDAPQDVPPKKKKKKSKSAKVLDASQDAPQDAPPKKKKKSKSAKVLDASQDAPQDAPPKKKKKSKSAKVLDDSQAAPQDVPQDAPPKKKKKSKTTEPKKDEESDEASSTGAPKLKKKKSVKPVQDATAPTSSKKRKRDSVDEKPKKKKQK
eukprot:TRINITY_DN3981_c0_g1_i1.p1 TRINITY_DN3981_c0_g1~~TRINITY_DN3981_c0_g1_i1.p1  ORF type:complete len:349 (-),score=113.44 TRINITY_DN3981_c0_g1_i1:26-1072(-)